jgi:hypothetical protein
MLDPWDSFRWLAKRTVPPLFRPGRWCETAWNRSCWLLVRCQASVRAVADAVAGPNFARRD